MSEKERLQLENECLMKYSKAQMIQKYIDELEESSKLSELWCKSQQENQELKLELELYENGVYYSSELDKKDKEIEELKKQQKEFIEYLESEIDTITQQKETFAELDAGQGVYLMTLAIVLEKYKEIIGEKDE